MSRKPRPLTWMQQRVLELTPVDGKWHRIPAIATHAVITGLVSRGLIEHRPSSKAMFEWITMGQIRRLATPATTDEKNGD